MNLEQALERLDTIRDKDAFDDTDIDALKDLSEHHESEVRYFVAEALIGIKHPQAEGILIALLSDKNYLVRTNACDSLCTSRNSQTIEFLKKVIVKDKSGLVRHYAVLSIGDIAVSIKIDRQELLRFLERRLEREKNVHTQNAFFRTMFMLGDYDKLHCMLNQLSNTRYQNRIVAIKNLGEIAGRENKDKIVAELEKLNKIEKTYAVKSVLQETLDKLTQG